MIANPQMIAENNTGNSSGNNTRNGRDPFFYGWREVYERGPDGASVRKQIPLTQEDVLHPQEGDFIMTNDVHIEVMAYLRGVFKNRLHQTPGALVLTDHRVDWQVPGVVPHGPDVSVFAHSDPWDPHRGTYMMRDMHAEPVCAIEITSPSTRNLDLDEKITEYGIVGIPLYVIVDLRLQNDRPDYRLLAYRPTPDGSVRLKLDPPNRVWIPVVNVWLVVTPDQVLCLDEKGNQIGDYIELTQSVAEQTARAEAAAKTAAEEKARAEAEKQRADAAEARLRELEAKLNKPKRKKQ